MKSKLATVDPGLIGTGIAIWRDFARDSVPYKISVLCPSRKLPWLARCHILKQKLLTVYEQYNVCRVYCELPAYFGSSAVGHAAAQRGDVVKLTFAAGMAAAAIWEFGGDFETVEINAWKGQLPKEVVERRIRRLIGYKDGFGDKIKTHAWDAVGIGLYLGGRFV